MKNDKDEFEEMEDSLSFISDDYKERERSKNRKELLLYLIPVIISLVALRVSCVANKIAKQAMQQQEQVQTWLTH